MKRFISLKAFTLFFNQWGSLALWVRLRILGPSFATCCLGDIGQPFYAFPCLYKGGL